ncbi:MAG TPA: amino acid permease [Bacteroidia bacterium]|nr:amino acid permease [Bacteroidia bacterium]
MQPASGTTHTDALIQPRLKTFDLTMIVAGLVIGMGIFRTPVEVAQKAGIPLVFFLAWITGAVVSLAGALTFAEIGSRYPVAGGFYKLFSRCYSPRIAFMVNWIIVISNAASTAGVVIMGAEYIVPVLFPQWNHETATHIVAIATVLFLGGINLSGIKMSARLLNVLMVIKITLLAALIASPFFINASVLSAPATIADQSFDPFHAFLLCFIPVFFTYGGYQQTINFGSDIKNAPKNLPKAIILGMILVTIIYLAVNFAYYKVLGLTGIQGTTTLASDIMGMLFGGWARQIVSIFMFLSVMAFVNVSVMSNPRVYLAMAQDKILPDVFCKVNTRTQVPVTGVLVFCLFILITLFFLSTFQHILEFVMFFDSVSLITAAAAIFILRKRAAAEGEPTGIYKMKAYPLLPAFFIIVYSCVMIAVFIANMHLFLWGCLLFVLGYPLYNFVRRN